MQSKLIDFVGTTLNCDEDKALDFIEEFNNCSYIDTFDLAFAELREYFPDDFTLDNDTKIKYGRLIEEGQLRYNEIKRLFKAEFDEFNCGDLDYSLFEGKTLIPHVKDSADPMSKRCNAVLCKIVLYNADTIYLKNEADGNIYVVRAEDLE